MQLAQCCVPVDAREPPVCVDYLARHHDKVHGVSAPPLDHSVEYRSFRVEIGIGDLVPIDKDEIGSLANRQAADPAAKGRRHRAPGGCPAQDLADAWDIRLVHSRQAMRPQYHPHFLQHVAIVVDAGLVEADRGIDAALLEEIERRKAAAQAEVGAAIVADMGAGRGNAVEIGLVEPHAMPQCQPRPEEPETIDIVEGGAAAAPASILLLEWGLYEG